MATLLIPDREPEEPALRGAFRRATMLACHYARCAGWLTEPLAGTPTLMRSDGSEEVGPTAQLEALRLRDETRHGVNEDWRRLDGGKSLNTLCEWALFDALDLAARAHPDASEAERRLFVFEDWWPECAGRIPQAAFREAVAAWAKRGDRTVRKEHARHAHYLLSLIGLRSASARAITAVRKAIERWAEAQKSEQNKP